MPLTTIQKLMRHSKPDITARVYIHANMSDFRGAVEMLPGIGGGAMEEKQAAEAVEQGTSQGTLKGTLADVKTLHFTSPDAVSGDFAGEVTGNENPVFTGVSANKHGDRGKKEMVPRARIELATRGFSVRCSTN